MTILNPDRLLQAQATQVPQHRLTRLTKTCRDLSPTQITLFPTIPTGKAVYITVDSWIASSVILALYLIRALPLPQAAFD